tara:strand:+ start:163 stop:438 length:276 start_codon:yes stop_codon:yes gene_type:complete
MSVENVVNVTQADNFKNFVHIIATDTNFKRSLVDKVNECTNIPIVGEDIESKIFSYLFDCIIDVMENAADKLYADAVAEEREQKRLEEVKK